MAKVCEDVCRRKLRRSMEANNLYGGQTASKTTFDLGVYKSILLTNPVALSLNVINNFQVMPFGRVRREDGRAEVTKPTAIVQEPDEPRVRSAVYRRAP